MLTKFDRKFPKIVTRLLGKNGSKVVFREVGATFRAVMSIDGATNTLSWPSGDFVAQGLEVDGWVRLDSTAKKDNQGWAKISAVSTTTLTLIKDLITESGANVSVTKGSDYPTMAYVGSWEARYINGTSILPTDAMLLTDLRPLPTDAIPDRFADRFLVFDGEDPATAKQYTVKHITPIRTGVLAPLGMIGARA